jgi:ABC-type Fe3+ transport system permease subunit
MLRVGLSLIAKGLGTGSALVFLAVVTEVTTTFLLAPIAMRTLATAFGSPPAKSIADVALIPALRRIPDGLRAG